MNSELNEQAQNKKRSLSWTDVILLSVIFDNK